MAPPRSKKRSPSRRRVVVRDWRGAPPPLRNPLLEGWRHMSWGFVIALFAGAGVIATAIISMFSAFPHVEPYIPATSGYVREYADETATKKVTPIEKWKSAWENDYGQFKVLQSTETARLILVQLQQNLVGAKKELEANPSSQIVKNQISALEEQIKQTRNRIQDYEAAALKAK